MPITRLAALLIVFALLTGCAELSYYLHSVRGHHALLQQAQDIDELLGRAESGELALEPDTLKRLRLAGDVRQFARDVLKLTFNDSYTRYADLQRDFAVMNLVAAGEFSTELHNWCYPVIGCAGYRGYYDVERLVRDQEAMDAAGYDTFSYKVSAYSTLGWSADPVLNTFLAMPEYRFVGLLLHELAHQQLYIPDDTEFNESFASAIEYAGLSRYFEDQGNYAAFEEYGRSLNRRSRITDAAARTREQLATLYAANYSREQTRREKGRLLSQFSDEYAILTDSDTGEGSQRQFNNASLAIMVAYSRFTSAFLALLKSGNGDFDHFYARVDEIAALPPEERTRCLEAWALSPASAARACGPVVGD